MAREVVVVSGARTPVGGYGGSLKDMSPSELGAHCVREAVSRAGIEPSDVGHVVFGNVIHTDPTITIWPAWRPSTVGSRTRPRP